MRKKIYMRRKKMKMRTNMIIKKQGKGRKKEYVRGRRKKKSRKNKKWKNSNRQTNIEERKRDNMET